jgi:hypothetical protein
VADPTRPGGGRLAAFPRIPNPLSWLGDQAGMVVADVWKAAMTGLWSASLWLLQLAFRTIDAFTTPDLAGGPIGPALPMIGWLAGSTVGIMFLVQLALVVIRRDGKSLAQLLLGTVQFGAVWVSYLAVAGALVLAAAGLAHGILQSMLHVGGFSMLDVSHSWPRRISDVTAATVLGISGLLLVIPAAFLYLIVMVVREVAIILLVATAPISAAGLVSDVSKVWFWKTLRWFLSALLIAPVAALIIGLGVQIAHGVIDGHGDQTAAAVGMAVVSALIILIGALCPLVLFKLLAFVEPGTASGAALRQSWDDAGGMSGLLSGRGAHGGGAAASSSGPDGRSHGEITAESAGLGRMAQAIGPVGQVLGAAMRVSGKTADLATDVLGAAGIGHPSYAAGMADYQAGRGRGRSLTGPDDAPGTEPTDGGPEPPPWTPPTPPSGDRSPGPASGGGPDGGAAPTGPPGTGPARATGATGETPVVPL